jgi:histidinol-phosphate aminotransferase
MLPKAKPSVAALAPYPLGEQTVAGVERVINLASNENAEQPSQTVQEACRQALTGENRYPEASAGVLREAIAVVHGLDPGRIVCANGSSELISLLAHAYCCPGDEVVVGRYGYLFFKTAAQIAGAIARPADSDHLGFDPDAVLAAITPRTRVVFLDNPSNPTATILHHAAVQDLRARIPGNVLLVIDAAYAEYVTDNAYNAGVELVDLYGNCVMLRTFSKVYGLAGLRVGWAYVSADVADVLHRVRQPNNLSGVSIAGAAAAVAEQELVSARRGRNAQVRDAFASHLRDTLGFAVVPSHANFLLVSPALGGPVGAGELAAKMKRAGILLRSMTPYDLPNNLRITIGTAEEMELVQDALDHAFP